VSLDDMTRTLDRVCSVLLPITSIGLIWALTTNTDLKAEAAKAGLEAARLRGLLETTHVQCDAAKSETAMCRQAVDYCGQSRKHLEEALKEARAK
jgi:hypothetical protein